MRGSATAAENWTMARMAPTDRNALRLGAFELLFTETPHRVVIDETIELARRFGTAQSPQFVNGILDKLIPPEKRLQEKPEEPTPELHVTAPLARRFDFSRPLAETVRRS